MEPAVLSDLLKTSYPEITHENRLCGKHGSYLATQLASDLPFSDCPACNKEAKSRIDINEIAQRNAAAKEDQITREFPRRFRSKTFDNFDPSVDPKAPEILSTMRSYAENFSVNLDAGRCLLIIGGQGTGKNHLVNALARHIIIKGYSVRMLDASDMVYRVRNTWSLRTSETEADVLNELSKLDLLVINELGVLSQTESEKRILFRIINRRYEDQRPSIIIGNVTREEAQRILGLPSYDRLREDGGQVLVFDWQSYRK